MRGGQGHSGHGSLQDRIARTLADQQALTREQAADHDRQPLSPARHCTVDGQASLLVEWLHNPTGWTGRVISVVWIDGVGWATIDRWLPARMIRPAGS